MKTQLLTQCGSQRCSIEQLLAIPEPEKTESYTPLNHYALAVNTLSIASDILKGYRFDGDSYALSSAGQKMFGVITFRKINSTSEFDCERLFYLGLSISHFISFPFIKKIILPIINPI